VSKTNKITNANNRGTIFFFIPDPQNVRVDARTALSQALRAYRSKKSTADLWSYQGVIHQAGELNMQNPSQKRREVTILSHCREYGVSLKVYILVGDLEVGERGVYSQVGSTS
jgi:hypothetical protein